MPQGHKKQKIWRRGWDLNPRYPLRYVRFRGGSFQPLTHLSEQQLSVASKIFDPFAGGEGRTANDQPRTTNDQRLTTSTYRRFRKNSCKISAERPASTPPLTSI